MTVYVWEPLLCLPDVPNSGTPDPVRTVTAVLCLDNGKKFSGTNWLPSYYLTWPSASRALIRRAAVHAERHVILSALEHVPPSELVDALMYVSLEPCADCRALIEAAGVRRVVYRDRYVPSDAKEAQ